MKMNKNVVDRCPVSHVLHSCAVADGRYLFRKMWREMSTPFLRSVSGYLWIACVCSGLRYDVEGYSDANTTSACSSMVPDHSESRLVSLMDDVCRPPFEKLVDEVMSLNFCMILSV